MKSKKISPVDNLHFNINVDDLEDLDMPEIKFQKMKPKKKIKINIFDNKSKKDSSINLF